MTRLIHTTVLAQLGILVGCLTVLTTGCGPKPTVKIPVATTQIAGFDEITEEIVADPLKFMGRVLEASRKLDQCTVQFQRRERLGLLKELQPMEHIFAELRREPFSIRFTWLDEDSEYLQCVYVHGKKSNNVSLLPRHGLFGLPASVMNCPAHWAVLFGKARNPITDFGPQRMIERILDRIKKAEPIGGVKIRLLPATEIGPDKAHCFHIEMRYPEKDQYPCKLHDFYIHTRTLLPVASYLWLPGKDERSGETLDAMYLYGSVAPTVELTDDNFKIDAKFAKSLGKSTHKAKKKADAAVTDPEGEEPAPAPAPQQTAPQSEPRP